MAAPEACPLCGGETRGFLSDAGRDYLRCGTCALTFRTVAQHAAPAVERARYEEHRNGPYDPGYRAFLERVLGPLTAALPAGAQGLDYGCGPGPAASTILRERGFPTADYDPFFHPDASLLGRAYDFLVCTEVLEHLRRPAEDLARLDSLLKPGGVLGAMTGVLEDDAAFRDWWYRRDFTHISFYRPETLSWIAARFGWSLERVGRDAVLFRKPARGH